MIVTELVCGIDTFCCDSYNDTKIVLFFSIFFLKKNLFRRSQQVAKGDLETMLHDANIYLSLTTRMKMARDAALGMNWLHLSTPKFIHRDLKTSNLLVDENMRIKVKRHQQRARLCVYVFEAQHTYASS